MWHTCTRLTLEPVGEKHVKLMGAECTNMYTCSKQYVITLCGAVYEIILRVPHCVSGAVWKRVCCIRPAKACINVLGPSGTVTGAARREGPSPTNNSCSAP